MEELNKMEINDILHTGDYEIIRVPGGWTYTRFSENGTGGHDMSSCFVPEPMIVTISGSPDETKIEWCDCGAWWAASFPPKSCTKCGKKIG